MFGKKKSPVFAIAIGALAVFGAYSMVAAVKNCCTEKMKMMTNLVIIDIVKLKRNLFIIIKSIYYYI